MSVSRAVLIAILVSVGVLVLLPDLPWWQRATGASLIFFAFVVAEA